MIPRELVAAVDALPGNVACHERKARKDMTCKVCLANKNGDFIHKGEAYASITYGFGLAAIKFPDRVHISCLPEYIAGRKEVQHG